MSKIQDAIDLDDASRTVEGIAQLALAGHREELRLCASLIAQALRVVGPGRNSEAGVYPKAGMTVPDLHAGLELLASAMDAIAAGGEPNRVLGWTSPRRGRKPLAKTNPRLLYREADAVELAHSYGGGQDGIARAAAEMSMPTSKLAALYKNHPMQVKPKN